MGVLYRYFLCLSDGISCRPPEAYATRFIKFCREHLFSARVTASSSRGAGNADQSEVGGAPAEEPVPVHVEAVESNEVSGWTPLKLSY